MLPLAAAAVISQAAPDIAAPNSISITSEIDGDALFNITLGDSGGCLCESPRCIPESSSSTRLRKGEILTFQAASTQCSYYNVGGAISSILDGTVCYTWRADFSSCTVYPSHAFSSSFTAPGAGACSRLVGASCRMRTSLDAAGAWKAYPTVIALTGPIDRCDTLPWNACTESSSCCGGEAGFACRHQRPDVYGDMTRICQPPHGGLGSSVHDDPRVYQAWQAKGVKFNG